MKKSDFEKCEAIVASLSPDEKTILRDCIRCGAWGDTVETFLDADGGKEEVGCYGYCTNDASEGGHFKGRKVSSLFRSLVAKLAPLNGTGAVFAHASDWWGDGSGDMLFIRSGFYQLFDEWAVVDESSVFDDETPDEAPVVDADADAAVDAAPQPSKLRIAEMMRFENFLWSHHNPAEVLEDWADDATSGIMRLAVLCDLDPCDISLPLSPVVLDYVRHAHEWFRTPLSERDENEVSRDFYPGAALSDDELRWVARHVQDGIIPAD